MAKMGTGAKIAIAVVAGAAVLGGIAYAVKGGITSYGGTPGGPQITITIS